MTGRRTVSLFLVFFSCYCYGDVSDEYKSYIDQIIPKTFRMAKADAYVREAAIATNRFSLAQSHLSVASTKITAIAFYISVIKATGEGFCPVYVDGSLDVRTTLQQLSAVSFLGTYALATQNHIANFRKLKNQIDNACDDEHSFEQYRVSNIPFVFYTPKEVGLLDGTNIVIILGDSPKPTDSGRESPQNSGVEASTGRNERGIAAIPIIGDCYQVIHNRVERGELADQRRRLYLNIVNDQQYRKYAKESCKLILEERKQQLLEYVSLVNNLENVISSLPRQKLEKRRLLLEQCLGKFEDQFVKYVENRALAKTNARKKRVGEETASLKLAIKVNERINLNLARLESTECGKGRLLIEALESDGSLSELMNLPNLKRLIPEVRRVIRKRHADCKGVDL